MLERLQSECDIVIRYYRSTVIPDDNKSKVCYRIVKKKFHMLKNWETRILDSSHPKVLKPLQDQDGTRYFTKLWVCCQYIQQIYGGEQKADRW